MSMRRPRELPSSPIECCSGAGVEKTDGGGDSTGTYTCNSSIGIAFAMAAQCDSGLLCGGTGSCCEGAGATPASAADCCSGDASKDGKCTCDAPGAACKTNVECCLGSCQSGVCACGSVGAICGNDSLCCSGSCTDGSCACAATWECAGYWRRRFVARILATAVNALAPHQRLHARAEPIAAREAAPGALVNVHPRGPFARQTACAARESARTGAAALERLWAIGLRPRAFGAARARSQLHTSLRVRRARGPAGVRDADRESAGASRFAIVRAALEVRRSSHAPATVQSTAQGPM